MRAAQDRRIALAGIDILRKVCNHPDLLQRAKWEGAPDYGNPARSGKLTVAMKARHPALTLIPTVWHAQHTINSILSMSTHCTHLHSHTVVAKHFGQPGWWNKLRSLTLSCVM